MYYRGLEKYVSCSISGLLCFGHKQRQKRVGGATLMGPVPNVDTIDPQNIFPLKIRFSSDRLMFSIAFKNNVIFEINTRKYM